MTMHLGWMAGWMMLSCGPLLAGGCTRENPAFGDADGATSTDDPSGGDATSGTLGDTTKATASDSTMADDTSTTDPGDGGTEASSSGGDTEDGMVCPQHPLAPIDIAVFEANGSPVAHTKACNRFISTNDGTLVVAEGTVRHQTCVGCECEAAEGLTLELGASLHPPAKLLPTCGKLLVWEGLDPYGNCHWDGFAILEELVSEIPTYLALNSRYLPVHFGIVPIALEPENTCEDVSLSCDLPPGRYALDFPLGPPVFVGTSEELEIAVFTEITFEVDNRMASIDTECREHVAWTALQIQ